MFLLLLLLRRRSYLQLHTTVLYNTFAMTSCHGSPRWTVANGRILAMSALSGLEWSMRLRSRPEEIRQRSKASRKSRHFAFPTASRRNSGDAAAPRSTASLESDVLSPHVSLFTNKTTSAAEEGQCARNPNSLWPSMILREQCTVV